MLIASLVPALVACIATPPLCSCAMGEPLASRARVAEAVDMYAAVFEGVVLRTEYDQDSKPADTSRLARAFHSPDLIVTVAVGRRWKGQLGRTVIVRTDASTTMCGADFTKGRRYLIFARLPAYTGLRVAAPAREGKVVYTTKCDPTTEAAARRARLADLLGAPLRPGT